MKSKIIFLFMCILLLCMAVTRDAMAQQPADVRQANQTPMQMRNGQSGGNYSFNVFIAPNKLYGYDILNSGRVIFHQPAYSKSPGDNNVMLTKKGQATLAAIYAIEKIKKGMNPELSGEELRKITGH